MSLTIERVVELRGIRSVHDGSTQYRVPSIWGLGTGLVSQVPSLGDAWFGKKSGAMLGLLWP